MNPRAHRFRPVPMAAGLAVAGMLLAVGPPGELGTPAWRTLAIAALMATWWVSEALPVAATALVPLVAFPLLGIAPVDAAARPYANPLIYLFLGGFMLALAVERWGLHRRIALHVLRLAGGRPDHLVGGFMLATGVISMWVSNTATTIMMLPIASSVVPLLAHDADDDEFALALFLAIAYAASIGGVGTLIGTPPNAFMAAFMSETYGIEIGFARWMLVGLPVASVMMLAAWLLLTRWRFRLHRRPVADTDAVIQAELEALGPISGSELRVAMVFVCVAGLWVLRPYLAPSLEALTGGRLSDPVIAIAGALALFMIPCGRDAPERTALLDWKTAEHVPWGVLLLFGGGLSLASAIAETGLAVWLAHSLTGLAALPVLVIVMVTAALILMLTEISSNTATTAAFLPVIAALAVSIGQHPLLLVIPSALAASCAFMLPVATPPNAIVFSSGRVTIPQMARAGVWLNLLALVVVTALTYSLALSVFGIDLGEVPPWADGARSLPPAVSASY
ncbi:MAG: DASS family sodium-coupled anion symporter [Gammaproteobacteria bacterium]|nr:DASS family sodium-coupled anion symporter [Gammaproteobacteria bacterium]NNM01409.1 DASS family sodium-coupled anion symporter [Gammaproteobacteria bacterium]